MQVVEPRRKWKDEIGPSEHIFRITTVDRIAGEDGRIAKVLHASAAIPASAVGAANPRNSYASAGRKVRSGAFHDVADDLMSGNQALPPPRKFPLHNMQVGTANPASADLQQNMARLQRGARNFLYAKRTLGNILGCRKDRRCHLNGSRNRNRNLRSNAICDDCSCDRLVADEDWPNSEKRKADPPLYCCGWF